MDIQRYLAVLTRGWWIILTALVVSTLATAIFSLNQTPVYRADATFIVSAGRGVDAPKTEQMATYAEVAASRSVVDRAKAALNLAAEDYTVKSVVRPDAYIVQLSVEGPNPQVAAALANAASREATARAQNLYQNYQISVLDAALPPADPVRPQPARDIGLGTVLGLTLGLVLSFGREYLRGAV